MSQYLLIQPLPEKYAENKDFNTQYSPGMVLDLVPAGERRGYFETSPCIFEDSSLLIYPEELGDCFAELPE